MAKLLKYLLIFMLPLAIVACSKDEPKNGKDDDDDDDRIESVNIAGTWTGTIDFDEDGEGYDTWSEKWTLNLKSNGKFTLDLVELDYYGDEYSLYGTYSYNESSERLRLNVQGDSEEGDWGSDSESVTFGCRISGNKMYLTGNDIDGTATLTRKK